MMPTSRPIHLLAGLVLALSLAGAGATDPKAAVQIGPDFRYGGPEFAAVARTSYQTVGLDGSFEDWLAGAYQKTGVRLGDAATGTLKADLDARARAIQAASGEARVSLERETASWAHRFVKKAIPKFSLDRGFELANVVRSGERQCLAQSFIISALLQRAGLRAGAVMVWANPAGQQSNLGHVVSVVRLSNGRDLLVDASDPTPFVHHQGLLVNQGGKYLFVKPSYGPDDTIGSYTVADSGRRLTVDQASPLTLAYLHSQFDYYRGERATGGFMGTGVGRATPDGLKQSAFYLRRALQEEPQNALAGFVLGHVLQRQGQLAAAKTQYDRANRLYLTQGHVPSGVPAALAALAKPAGAGKS